MTFKKTFLFFLFISINGIILFAQNNIVNNLVEQGKALETKGKETLSEVNGVFERIQEKTSQLKNINKAADRLKGPQLLPFAVETSIGNLGNGVMLAFAQTEYEEEEGDGVGTLFLKIALPDVTTPIYFGAKGMSLSTGGLAGQVTLSLIGDVPVSLMNNKALITFKGSENIVSPGGDVTGQTFATLSCKGIEEISVTADIEFSKDVLIPLDANFNTIANQRVKTHFQVVVKSFQDLLVNVDLPPFTVKGIEGFAFSMKKAVFDMSGTRNSSDCKLPASYATEMPDINLWQGVCISSFDILLPKEFKRKSNQEGSTKTSQDNANSTANATDTTKKDVLITDRIRLNAQDLLIDHSGVTGKFSGLNLMSLKDGDASGWDFSLDLIQVELERSNFKKAVFSGKIVLPMDKNKKSLGYEGKIETGGNYSISLSLDDEMETDLFGMAKLKLLPNSTVIIRSENGSFKPKVILNGEMTLGATTDKSDNANSVFKAKFDFEELTFMTDAPYVSVKSISYKDKIDLSGFPVQITELGFNQENDILHLVIGAKVALMENKLSGGTVVDIGTAIDRKNGQTSFRVHSFEIKEISVEGKFSKVNFAALIRYYKNDPTYGTGFKGMAKMGIELDPKKIDVEALAQFGTVKGFRYFRFEFGVSGLELKAGIIEINSIRGGFSYHMRRVLTNYIPDENYGLGLKAMIGGGVVAKEAIAASIGFEINFNPSFGLKNLGLFASAHIMPNPQTIAANSSEENTKKQESQVVANAAKAPDINSPNYFKEQALTAFSEPIPSSGLYAKMGIYFDFDNSVFVASFDVYMNVAGGLIKGGGEYNKAGWGELYFSKNEWHFFLGTPEDRWNVEFDLGTKLNSTFYLMAGNHGIPADLPPPPEQVARILGNKANNTEKRSEMLKTGAGFALGASMSIKTDIDVWIIYANLEMGLGFDILLRKYEGIECRGRSGPIGNNGWYAKGQFYAYLIVDLGVKVDIWFFKGKIPILKGSVAALLKAELPNPTWIYGRMAGDYSLLGGMVNGRFDFAISMGEKCEMVAADGGEINPLAGMSLINDITPSTKSTDVSVFALPQVVFAFALDKEFKIDESTPPFRIKLKTFEVQRLKPSITWETIKNADKKSNYDNEVLETIRGDQRSASSVSLMFKQYQVLPPLSIYQVKASVIAQEKKDGVWKDIMDKGQPFTESKVAYFQTGTAPNYIAKENIKYMYPADGQEFYLPGESQQGYIRLDIGQDYLFANKDKYDYFLEYKYENSTETAKTSFTTRDDGRLIEWQMPKIENTKKYTVRILADPKIKGVLNAGVKQSTTQIGNTTIKENKAVGTAENSQAIKYLDYSFKSSAYNTFKEKMQAKTVNQNGFDRLYYSVFNLAVSMTGGEGFDETELQGNPYTDNKPLIEGSLILNDAYFIQHANPKIYQIASNEGFGVQAPYNGLKVNYQYLENKNTTWLPYIYNAFDFYYRDQNKVQDLIMAKYKNKSIPNSYLNTLFYSLPSIDTKAIYNGQMQYVLPGNKKTPSTFIIDYKF